MGMLRDIFASPVRDGDHLGDVLISGPSKARYADDETEQGAPPPRAVGVDTASQVEAGRNPGLKIMPPRRRKYAASPNPAAVTATPWATPAVKPATPSVKAGTLPNPAAPSQALGGAPAAPAPPVDPKATAEWKKHGTNSSAFLKWFGDWRNDPGNSSKATHPKTGEPHESYPISYARDDGGHPIIVHHGTTHEFEAFDRSKADPEGHVGNGFYFTSNSHDADNNYAGHGPDMAARVARKVDDMESQYDDGDDAEGWLEANRGFLPDGIRQKMTSDHVRGMDKAARDDLFHQVALAQFHGGKPNRKSFYLNLRNPVVLDKKGGTRFGVDYPEGEPDEDGYPNPDYDNPEGKGHELAEAIRAMAEDYDEEDGDPADADQIIHNLGLYDGEDQTAHELMERLAETNPSLGKSDPSTGDHQYLSGQFLKDAFQRMGHDGIIYNDAHQYFPKMVSPGTRHYVAFHPHQVKSVDNHGTFDPQDERFRYDESDGLPAAPPKVPKARKPRAPKVSTGKSSTPESPPPTLPPATPAVGSLPAGHPAHTPEFKNWFGPWDTDPGSSSKVVHPEGYPREEYGLPKVAYHGTPKGGFDRFDAEKDKGRNIFGKGFYFTEDPDVARSYTQKDMKVSGRHLATQVVPEADRPEAFETYLDGIRNQEYRQPKYRDDFIEDAEGNRADFMKHGSIFHMIRPDYSRYEPWYKNTTDPNTREKLRASYRQAGLGKDLDKEYEDWQLKHAMPVAEEHGLDVNPTAEVKKAYLNIRNPFDMTRTAGKSDYEALRKHFKANPTGDNWDTFHLKHVYDDLPFGDEVDDPSYAQVARIAKHYHKRNQGSDRELFPDPTGKTMTWHGLHHVITDGHGYDNPKATILDWIKKRGHDGITHIGGGRYTNDPVRHRVWIAMHPHQIKSVDNKGKFDPGDDRIDYAEAGVTRMARNVVERLPAGRFTTPPKPLVIRMGEDGVPVLSLRSRVRYEGIKDKEGHYHVPHNMVVGGKPFTGGEFMPHNDPALAHATPQQLAMLGTTADKVRADLGAKGVAMNPAAHGPGQVKPQRADKNSPTGVKTPIVASPDMLPEDMRDLVHPETLGAITSREGLEEMVALYRQTQEAHDGVFPSQDTIEALAVAGESVRGHYEEFLKDVTQVFGVDGAKVWALANGILSPRTAYMEHTLGAFRLVGEWIARGKPSEPGEVSKLIDDWKNIRKHGTDPNEGPRAYTFVDDPKRAKLTKLLSDPGNFGTNDMAQDAWAKTPEFSGSFLDGTRVAIDTHMGKLLGMGDSSKSVEDKLKWVTDKPQRYGAYKAAVVNVGKKLGWKPSEVQEAVWGAVLGVSLMKRHGASAGEVDKYLTHGTMGQTWDMNTVFHMPELCDVFRKVGVPESALEDLGRQGPGQGGLQKRGLDPAGAVRNPKPEAFARAADWLDPAAQGSGQGVVPVLPSHGQPAGWNPDEAYFKRSTEAPNAKAFKATLASRELRDKKLAAKAAEAKAPSKSKKRAARSLTVGEALIRYLRIRTRA